MAETLTKEMCCSNCCMPMGRISRMCPDPRVLCGGCGRTWAVMPDGAMVLTVAGMEWSGEGFEGLVPRSM